jgi:bleomycin hydrolase
MSDSNKPYYQEIELDTKDNWLHDRYLNIPMDSLIIKAERAVRHHHGVFWGDENHGMAIVGIAHDDDGEKYFIMKNSWGTDRPYKGLEYVSFEYFRKHTFSLVMTKEAYGLP